MSYSQPKYDDEFVSDRKPSLGQQEQLHPLLNVSVPKGVEYIQVDDPSFGSGWADTLIYHTGVGFLTAGSAGLAVGVLQGIRQTAGIPHLKLRANGILNAATRRGHIYANSVAAVVLSFHLVKKIANLALSNEEADIKSYVGTGALIGSLYNIPLSTDWKKLAMSTSLGALFGAAGFLFTVQPKDDRLLQ